MALLQLATRQRVYLLDMLTLTTVLSDHDWNALAEQLFANENVLKIGGCKTVSLYICIPWAKISA